MAELGGLMEVPRFAAFAFALFMLSPMVIATTGCSGKREADDVTFLQNHLKLHSRLSRSDASTDNYKGPVGGYCKSTVGKGPEGPEGMFSPKGYGVVNLVDSVDDDDLVSRCKQACDEKEGCMGISVAPGVHSKCHLFNQAPDYTDGSWGWQCYTKGPKLYKDKREAQVVPTDLEAKVKQFARFGAENGVVIPSGTGQAVQDTCRTWANLFTAEGSYTAAPWAMSGTEGIAGACMGTLSYEQISDATASKEWKIVPVGWEYHDAYQVIASYRFTITDLNYNKTFTVPETAVLYFDSAGKIQNGWAFLDFSLSPSFGATEIPEVPPSDEDRKAQLVPAELEATVKKFTRFGAEEGTAVPSGTGQAVQDSCAAWASLFAEDGSYTAAPWAMTGKEQIVGGCMGTLAFEQISDAPSSKEWQILPVGFTYHEPYQVMASYVFTITDLKYNVSFSVPETAVLYFDSFGKIANAWAFLDFSLSPAFS